MAGRTVITPDWQFDWRSDREPSTRDSRENPTPVIGTNGKIDFVKTMEQILTDLAKGYGTTRVTKLNSLISSKDELQTVVRMVLKRVSTSSHEMTLLEALAKWCNENRKINVFSLDKKVITFYTVLMSEILTSFNKFIQLRKKIIEVTRNYKGPEEKKEKWIESRFEEYYPLLKHSAFRNAEFLRYLLLEKMFTSTYIVTTVLTPLSEMKRADWLQLLCELLKHLGQPIESDTRKILATKQEYTQLFARIEANQSAIGSAEETRRTLRDLIELKENNWIPKWRPEETRRTLRDLIELKENNWIPKWRRVQPPNNTHSFLNSFARRNNLPPMYLPSDSD